MISSPSFDRAADLPELVLGGMARVLHRAMRAGAALLDNTGGAVPIATFFDTLAGLGKLFSAPEPDPYDNAFGDSPHVVAAARGFDASFPSHDNHHGESLCHSRPEIASSGFTQGRAENLGPGRTAR
jgi:hypothetical protein